MVKPSSFQCVVIFFKMFALTFHNFSFARLAPIFAILCVVNCKQKLQEKKCTNTEVFEVAHYWYQINFTWPSKVVYQEALNSQRYIPQNNVVSGIKTYQNRFYVTLPRFYPGTPVTLASFPIGGPKIGPTLEPYPNWDFNVKESCATLQNVQATEIGSDGVMWVLDGNRFVSGLTRCPPKILLLDMKNKGAVLQIYVVPDELSPHQGGWMNDLVIDESSGGYAYISEVSNQDPGIIVYSRKENRGWKIRDRSMFAEVDGAGYVVHGIALNNLFNVDGIALSPASKSSDERLLYYTTLTGFSMYALSTLVLKNESLFAESNWRKEVQYIGRRSGASDGMIIDSEGNLYFGLLNEYSIAKWNIYQKPFEKYVETVYYNYTTVDWPDSFTLDLNGNLYLTADLSERLLNNSQHAPPKDGITWRILKYHTGTKSYIY